MALKGWRPGRGAALPGSVKVHSVFGATTEHGASPQTWSYAVYWRPEPLGADQPQRGADPRCRYRLNRAGDLWLLEVWAPPGVALAEAVAVIDT